MLFELIAIGIAVVLALLLPRRVRLLVLRPVRRLAANRLLGILAVVLLALVLCVGFAGVVGMPVPFAHDEFAYLLGSDTFASGRLTNPSHPLREHFETYHVIQQPTRQMKYPPAQSLFMAAGQVVGNPAFGVWLSLALAAGAVCWALQSRVPARWAVFGTVLMLFNAGMMRLWGQSYWGGAVAMLGGALMYGAAFRLLDRRRPSSWWLGLLLGCGVVLLANTRPYEGLIASLLLLVWMVLRSLTTVGFAWVRVPVVASGAAALLAGFLAMGVYHHAVTGTPWKMPYMVWQETYDGEAWSTTLTGGERSTPATLFVEDGVRGDDWPPSISRKAVTHWFFFLRPTLTLPFLAFLFLRSRSEPFLMVSMGVVTLAVWIQASSSHPHYSAPIAPLLYLASVEGLRAIRASCRVLRSHCYRAFDLLPLAAAASLAFSVHQWTQRRPVPEFALHRKQIVEKLSLSPEPDLVVVRYRPGHQHVHEWVYNAADIDASPVVWARELSPKKNQQLLRYFADRRVWLLDADREPPQLIGHE